jgi:hypothetical protein
MDVGAEKCVGYKQKSRAYQHSTAYIISINVDVILVYTLTCSSSNKDMTPKAAI